MSLRAGRDALAERLPSDEGTPRLEGQPFRTAVRWADIFGLELFGSFWFKPKGTKEEHPLGYDKKKTIVFFQNQSDNFVF